MSVDIQDVHTYYGESHVLQGVSLRVASAQLAVVLGRNGVGKSTLAKTLAGFLTARVGSIVVGDTEIARCPPHRIGRAGVALVPQGRRIFPSVTVAEHLGLAAGKPAANRQASCTIDGVLELFPELRQRLNVRAGKLSGGEQQMLAIGRALLRDPQLIVLDEPSEGLAPQLVARLVGILRTLRDDGCSVLLLEQNVEFALRCADIVYVMHKGAVIYEGTKDEFLSEADDLRRRYLAV